MLFIAVHFISFTFPIATLRFPTIDKLKDLIRYKNCTFKESPSCYLTKEMTDL